MDYKDFLNKEYDTLTDAHFRVSERTTSFFQYLLVILSAPVLLIAAEKELTQLLQGFIYCTVGVIGSLILLYLSQLRFEAILYARSVNRLRNLILQQMGDINSSNTDPHILYIQSKIPPYVDLYQFIWVYLAVSLINSLYITYGSSLLLSNFQPFYVTIGLILIFMVSFILSFLMYTYIGRRMSEERNFFENRVGLNLSCVIDNTFIKTTNSSKEKLHKEIKTYDIFGVDIKVLSSKQIWNELEFDKNFENLVSKIQQSGNRVLLYNNIQKYNFSLIDCLKIKKVIRQSKIPKIIQRSLIGSISLQKRSLHYDIHKNLSKFCEIKKIKYFVTNDISDIKHVANICKKILFIGDQELTQYFNVIKIDTLNDIFPHLNT